MAAAGGDRSSSRDWSRFKAPDRVGPGDIELLTIKALRLMQSADLVLYDRLISPEILQLVGSQAQMLYVGKEAGLHTRPQDEILFPLKLDLAVPNDKVMCLRLWAPNRLMRTPTGRGRRS